MKQINKLITKAGVLSLILIAISVFYYLVIYLPQINRAKVRTAYLDCLIEVDKFYDDKLGSQCKENYESRQDCVDKLGAQFCFSLGDNILASRNRNCRLPDGQREVLNGRYMEAQLNCSNKYSQSPEPIKYFYSEDGSLTTEKKQK